MLLFLLETIIFSNITVDINVITNNKSLETTIKDQLNDYKIKEYKIKKTNKYYNIVKTKLLNQNKDTIEWINIQNNGMKVIVNIEEKKEKKDETKPKFCNIIAQKDGIISKIITKQGTPIIDINEHVNKGDILISGEIKLNEETKEHICAEGTVFAHTWYTINISIPKTYKTKTKGKKYRYNIKIKNNNKTTKIFKTRIKEPVTEEKHILNIFGNKIYLLKEYSSSIIEKEYTKEETEMKIKSLINENLKPILINNNKIIKQNVLKKNDFNSTIDIELFIIVEEEISKQSYEIVKDDKE